VNIEYDSTVDAAYIYLGPIRPGDAEKTYACDPEEVDGQIHLDFDGDGRLIGIEVLGASHKLPKSLLKTASASK
jgi:uncharacterized protein YuzE